MPQKKQKILEKKISEIVIVNNRKLAPYIEVVNFSSRNIDQRKLGTILGIFEIKDTSEDSAYIVNFLASVAKKTYFASHHKTALESFESTLYRLNLSLSEVAKHGNINWIGKIDAVLCSIDEEEIHFSVSGAAKVLLLRDNRLTEISSGLSSKDEAANPIKTFTDIASGQIENGDKLIITTDDISHVFALEDLEKHSLSFTKDEFLRFLKTALINELDIAGTIVIDINEKIIEAKKVIPKKKEEDEEELIEQNINAFSNKTFEEAAVNKQATIEEITESDPEKDENEYTHEKTGHIYLKDQEENYDSSQNSLEKITIACREGFSNFCFWVNDRYIKKGTYQIKKIFSPGVSNTKTKVVYYIKSTILSSTIGFLKAIGTFFSNVFIDTGNSVKKIIPEKPLEIDVEIRNNVLRSKTNKLKKVKEAMSRMLPGKRKVSGIIAPQEPSFEKKMESVNHQTKPRFSFAKKIIPNFSKIIRFFSQMSKKNKFYIIGILIFILVAPIFAIKIQNKRSEIISEMNNRDKNNQEEMVVNPSSEHYSEAKKIYFGENILGTMTYGEQVFIISEDKIVKLYDSEVEEYPFPDYAKDSRAFSFMDDLNLIFLINEENKISSFSPISENFNENNIDIPENAEISTIGTYLTYIYLVDSKNDQIYRYPRAEGGFGEKTNWLKEDIDLENTTSVAIDESIYLIQDGNPIKLTRGRKDDFNLNKDGNSKIEDLFTSDDLGFIYVIDKQNGELVKFNRDGSIVSHHSNQELLKSNNLWVSENNSTSHFSTENEVFRIKTP